jgi:8-oxo-dGTP pyrophosphatase MutT (NUDIX family)
VAAKRFQTVRQVSAGGVVYRHAAGERPTEVALIRVGTPGRWQLPKGIVDEGESPELTAVREVREEAGLEARLVAPLEVIEYWYVGDDREGKRVRFHKFVHLFLLAYQAGDVSRHDHEVEEARWVALPDAEAMLAFESERKAMARARTLLNDDAAAAPGS